MGGYVAGMDLIVLRVFDEGGAPNVASVCVWLPTEDKEHRVTELCVGLCRTFEQFWGNGKVNCLAEDEFRKRFPHL